MKDSAIFFTVLGLLLFANASLGQEQLRPFPQNVNIHEFTSCHCRDTIEIKQTIRDIDFEGNEQSDEYSKFTFADLNGDGTCEILHYFSSEIRGWPYDFLAIYMLKDTIVRIGDFPSFLLSFAESDGKFLQINYGNIGGHKTNPIYYNSVWRFDGKRYVPFYSPNMTRGEFKNKGIAAYKKKNFEEAYICFNNALLMPYHGENQKLESANDVAITLIKLNRFDEVQPLLSKYIKAHSNNDAKAAAYYNLGLAMEKLNDNKEAIKYFEMSCKIKETNACKKKIEEIKIR
jgi:tetratricopeptide (TPR) repeat protein